MIKAIISLVVVSALIFVGWKFVPDSIKQTIADGMNKIGVGSVSSRIKSDIAKRLTPDDPVATRAALLQKLSNDLVTIKEHTVSLNAKDKSAVNSAIESSAELIQQIQDENAKGGPISNSIAKLIGAITPSNSCSTTN